MVSARAASGLDGRDFRGAHVGRRSSCWRRTTTPSSTAFERVDRHARGDQSEHVRAARASRRTERQPTVALARRHGRPPLSAAFSVGSPRAAALARGGSCRPPAACRGHGPAFRDDRLPDQASMPLGLAVGSACVLDGLRVGRSAVAGGAADGLLPAGPCLHPRPDPGRLRAHRHSFAVYFAFLVCPAGRCCSTRWSASRTPFSASRRRKLAAAPTLLTA